MSKQTAENGEEVIFLMGSAITRHAYQILLLCAFLWILGVHAWCAEDSGFNSWHHQLKASQLESDVKNISLRRPWRTAANQSWQYWPGWTNDLIKQKAKNKRTIKRIRMGELHKSLAIFRNNNCSNTPSENLTQWLTGCYKIQTLEVFWCQLKIHLCKFLERWLWRLSIMVFLPCKQNSGWLDWMCLAGIYTHTSLLFPHSVLPIGTGSDRPCSLESPHCQGPLVSTCHFLPRALLDKQGMACRKRKAIHLQICQSNQCHSFVAAPTFLI